MNWKWIALAAVSLLLCILATSADNAGIDGQPFVTDEISGVNILGVKLIEGADGTNDGYISSANPLPVDINETSLPITSYTPLETIDGLNVALGNVSGLTGVNQFGANADIDTGTEDIIDAGGDLVVTLSTTPATVAIYSSSANDVLAAGTLTFGDAGSENETITIASKVYTLRDSLTDVDGYVLRELAATDTIDNLIAAINLGAGSGTKYAASTTANAAPTSAVAGAGDTMTLYAQTAIATTTTVAGGWGGANAVLGTGARTVTIYGLNAAGALASETVNMRGITLTDTTATWSFIYKVAVASAGSGTVNAGLLKVVDNPETEIYAEVVATLGESRMACYKIPASTTGYLTDYYCSFDITPPAGADVTCFLFTKPSSAYLLKHQGAIATGGTTRFHHTFPVPLTLAAGTIIKLRATTDADNTLLDAGFTLILSTL